MNYKDETIIAIDYGMKRTGLAICPKGILFALPSSVVKTRKTTLETIHAIIDSVDETIDRFILGLPKYLDGKDSPMTIMVREFGKILEKTTKTPVHLVDESLTSESSEALLKDCGMNRKERTNYKDSLSAQLILKDFLENPELY